VWAKGHDIICMAEFVDLMLVRYGEALLAAGESGKGEQQFKNNFNCCLRNASVGMFVSRL